MNRRCIETEIWEDVPDKPHIVRYVDQRPANEVFEELKEYLSQKGLMPDEYFLLNHNLRDDNSKFPKGYIVCNADYGSNEGIYVDIKVVGEDGIKGFATGKTLYTSDETMTRMAQMACECTKVFSGQGNNEKVFSYTFTESEQNLVLEGLQDMRSFFNADDISADKTLAALDALLEKMNDHTVLQLPEETSEMEM